MRPDFERPIFVERECDNRASFARQGICLVNVFITVDTELWPGSPDWPARPLPADDDCVRQLSSYFYGGAAGDDRRGLPYQLRTLANAGLKATFFVESLFSFALGTKPLRGVVELIREHGQEVGLHLHPEWLTDPRCTGMPPFAGPLLHRYTEHDQTTLIKAGLEQLNKADAGPVCAFRAGSWGASLTTLRALRANGITYDSSLNECFPASFPDLDTAARSGCNQPASLEGIWEFPVTTFIDRRPAKRRPLHVCAASFSEFHAVLTHAYAAGWSSVVIVLHSFEFVRIAQLLKGKLPPPQRLLAGRFERLCAYLTEHADKYKTCHFADLHEKAGLARAPADVVVSSGGRTIMRQIQQLASRIY